MSTKRVVVTGLGIISSVGLGIRSFWEAIIHGKSGIGEIEAFDTSQYPSRYGGEVKNFVAGEHIDKETVSRIGRASQFGIAAAKQALEDSGIRKDQLIPERVGIVLGTTVGEGEVTRNINTKWIRGNIHSALEELIPKYLSYSIPACIGRYFGFCGPNIMIPTACAAGNYAICRAHNLIKYNTCDVVIAGGSDALSFGAYVGFNKLKAMAPKKVQPFDKNRKGMMLGEGAGILVLESYEHAKKRDAHVYCEVAGYGLGCDAFHMVIPHPEGSGIKISMESALRMAQMNPEDIEYINAHGTGTLTNDLAETLAIKSAFGQRAATVPISSIKSMIGHTMGAASAIEAVVCCLTLENNTIPPTINYEEPDPQCDLDYVPNTARSDEMKVVMSNALAFGGNNSTIILRKM